MDIEITYIDNDPMDEVVVYDNSNLQAEAEEKVLKEAELLKQKSPPIITTIVLENTNVKRVVKCPSDLISITI